MKIKVVRIEGFAGIELVEIRPGESALLIIGGKNRAGKSSVLNAITAAFRGKREAPEEPVRKGAKKAVIDIGLDDGYTLTRHFNKSGTHRVEIRGPDGDKISSPQAMLDRLVGLRFLDPLAFMRLDAKSQRDGLLRCVDLGIDLDEVTRMRSETYDKRRDIGRDIKRMDIELESIGDLEDISPISITALTSELQQAMEKRRVCDDARSRLAEVNSAGKRARETIDQMREEIAQKEVLVAKHCADLERLIDHRKTVVCEVDKLAADLASVDIEKLQGQIGEAEDHNATVASHDAKRVRYLELTASRNIAGAEHTACNDRLEDIDSTKMIALQGAKMPIEKLSVDDDCVIYDGVPLSQASGAQQLEVSLAIAMALKPELQDVWVKDGSLLDEDSLEIVRKLAEAHDCRVWLERVGDADDDCIVIEEGKVRE